MEKQKEIQLKDEENSKANLVAENSNLENEKTNEVRSKAGIPPEYLHLYSSPLRGLMGSFIAG